MKKFVLFFLAVTLSLFSIASFAEADTQNQTPSKIHQPKVAKDTITLSFFWSHDCPHCVAAHPFIERLKTEYPWLKVHSYEISRNSHNSRLFEKMAKDHGKETSFVPTFFVGDKMIVGYTSAETTGAEIRTAILDTHNSKK